MLVQKIKPAEADVNKELHKVECNKMDVNK